MTGPIDGFTAWQAANGEHVTITIDGEEVVPTAEDIKHIGHGCPDDPTWDADNQRFRV